MKFSKEVAFVLGQPLFFGLGKSNFSNLFSTEPQQNQNSLLTKTNHPH
jgi:hypothetical protein